MRLGAPAPAVEHEAGEDDGDAGGLFGGHALGAVGGAEQKIRKYLIDNNYVDAVIQLPPDLFFGTTIATCIIVLKKSKTDNAVLFIDGSAEFVRRGNKNKLSDANQQRMLDAFAAREDIDAIYRSATRTRARVRRDERDASLEETRAANRTLFVERRAKARVSSQRDLLAAMQGDRARYDAFAHDTAHTIDACDR